MPRNADFISRLYKTFYEDSVGWARPTCQTHASDNMPSMGACPPAVMQQSCFRNWRQQRIME